MKNYKGHILIWLLSALSISSFNAQEIVLERVVIGAAAQSFDNNADLVIDATIGETMVQTIETTDLIITEGFQQSNYILKSPLIIELVSTNAACLGANDGQVSVRFISSEIASPITYNWSNSDTGSSIIGLEVGMYSVTATGSNGKSVTNQIEVKAEINEDCTPIFYSGITPNGDGKNDTWFIDNADFFSSKKVKVYNRYGDLVWKSDNYDNVSDFFNGNHQNGNFLPDGTYFFVAEFDNSNYRGQIELTSGNE